MAFNDAAVDALFAAVESIAASSGRFRRVNQHEPKSLPGSGLTCAIWLASVEPLSTSGLNATSGYVVLSARIYGNAFTKPEDMLDATMTKAASALLGAYSADFTLGGTIRNIDLLGEYGEKLSGIAGFATIQSTVYRIFTVNIPCIVNDLWVQEA